MDITKNKSFSESSYIEYEEEYSELTIDDILTYIQTYPLSLNDNKIRTYLIEAIETEKNKYKPYTPLTSIIF